MLPRIIPTIYAVGLIALAAVSCIKDDTVNPDPGDGKVIINLYTNASAASNPITRADEDGIDPPIVLVFTGNDGTALFSEAAQAVGTGSTTTVSLTATTSESIFVVLANSPDYYGSGSVLTASSLTALLNNKYLSDLEDVLRTVDYIGTVSTRPYAGVQDKLPMSGLSTPVSQIDEYTQIVNATGKMELARAVAKAYVEVDPDVSGFTLEGIGAINVASNGALYSYSGAFGTYSIVDYLSSANRATADVIAPSADGVTTADVPLCLYETAVGDGPAMIVKGTYNTVSYYYKLGFTVNDTAIPVQRNKNYVFRITSAMPGYSTVEEAANAPASNLNFEIEVTDATGHDIISNGQYYLAVSNSTVLVYGDMTELTDAIVVTTDATATMGVEKGSIAHTPGLSVDKTEIEYDGQTAVKVTMDEASTSETVTLTVGNLIQTVSFIRYPFYSFPGFGTLPADDYVNLEMVSGGGEWFQMMDGEYNRFTVSEITFRQGQQLYITADPWYTEDNTRDAVFYTARAGSGGRTKVFVRQQGRYIDLHTTKHTVPENGYVGAFWRADQTGERLIRIPYTDDIVGDWTATVVDGEDWIKLDMEQSTDSGVTWGDTEDPKDMSLYDAEHQVVRGSTSVGGTVQDQNDMIYFRIGLDGTISPDGPPRYGVILINIERTNETVLWRIFVRQGEQDDYLMRPEDLTSSGGSYGDPNRPYAVKLSAFNITAPEYASDPDYFASTGRTGTTVAQHPQVAVRGGTFTDYPTQAGALFQWANAINLRRAFHPSMPVALQVSGWDNINPTGFWPTMESTYETCPEGYRRPMDHVDLTTNISIVDPADSELRQSLFYNPPANNSVLSGPKTIFGGYYADGFFDRRAVHNEGSTASYVSNNSVEPTNANVAYRGVVLYNPLNNASIFFPFAGSRDTNGRLTAGTQGFYPTATTPTNSYQFWYLSLSNQNMGGSSNDSNRGQAQFSTGYRYNTYAIRCVVDE